MTSYATIGSRGRRSVKEEDPNPLDHSLVQELALKYRKTPAQILLRHMIQRGINVIPKSITPSRIQENISIFDFHLSEDDVEKINLIKERQRFFYAPL
uniref:NADP-dependent oxidoreductase domain-containing protein n=1 Tax=Acrobeloides nanus TaxID=290746 RepID=A0A914C4K4_9BILA